MSEPLRVAFAGTPDFALPSLQALIDSPHQVVAVLTQPDRPKGRGRAVHMSPVKNLAITHGIPVLQPLSLRDVAVQQSLRALMVDVVVVVAYGLLLPPQVLTLPKYGCINVHGSILPRYRGAAPIVHALLAGDDSTGVSIMAMDQGLDTGPVYATVSCPIATGTDAVALTKELSCLGTDALLSVLDQMAKDSPPVAKSQSEQGVSLAGKVHKAHARLDWSQGAECLARHVCAYALWPVAFAHLGDEIIKFHQVKAMPDDGQHRAVPGAIVGVSPQGIDVATTDGLLQILSLQWPGGRVMAVRDCWHQARFVGANLCFT